MSRRLDSIRVKAARTIVGNQGTVRPRRPSPISGPPQPPEILTPLEGLGIVADVTKGELESQERRGDAIDTKAGFVLGFAGVLASIQLHGGSDARLVALSLDGLTALLAVLGLRPRPFPGLTPRRIRDYASWTSDQASLRVLDTRIEIYETTRRELGRKVQFLSSASVSLLVAVIATVVAGALGT